MKIKRLLILFTVLLFVTLLVMYNIIRWNSMNAKRDLPEIIKNNTLNVVSEYYTVNYQETDDYIPDFHYELCKFIAQHSGLTIQHFFEDDFEKAKQKLINKEYDVIAQNIPITIETRKYFDFTVPTGMNKQVLVQRKENENDSVLFISNQLDLANQTIYVTKNSPAILRLKNLSEEIAEPIHIKEMPGCTPEQLINMVIKREIDYFVTDLEKVLKHTGLFPGLDFNTDISFTQLQAWAVRKTSPVLLDSLNVWITEFLNSPSNK